MKCLIGYALRPSFHDLAYTIAMRIAYQEINQLQFAINKSMDTAMQFKLNFDVDRAPKTVRIKELYTFIHKLKEVVQKKNNSKAEKSSSKSSEQAKYGDKGKGKRLTDSFPSPISDEGPEIAPLITKRKRLSPAIRPKNSLIPQVSSNPAPSLDEDDHLTIKRLKVLHS